MSALQNSNIASSFFLILISIQRTSLLFGLFSNRMLRNPFRIAYHFFIS